MTKYFCDHCGRESSEKRRHWKHVEQDLTALGIFCSFNCLHLWAYEKSCEAMAKADLAFESVKDKDDQESWNNIYGPDSGRRDPELLMEAADMERKSQREVGQ